MLVPCRGHVLFFYNLGHGVKLGASGSEPEASYTHVSG